MSGFGGTQSGRLSIRVGNAFAVACERVACRFDDWARALKRCPECGENVFYGKPCPELRASWGYNEVDNDVEQVTDSEDSISEDSILWVLVLAAGAVVFMLGGIFLTFAGVL